MSAPDWFPELTESVASQLERIARLLRDGDACGERLEFTQEYRTTERDGLVAHTPTGRMTVVLTYVRIP